MAGAVLGAGIQAHKTPDTEFLPLGGALTGSSGGAEDPQIGGTDGFGGN